MLTIRNASGRRPLFRQYQNQAEPQPAYIWLNCDSEELFAAYSGEIGYCWTEGEYYNRELCWEVNPELSSKETNKLLKKIAPLAQKILEGYQARCDGSNMVAHYNDVAEAAIEKIEKLTAATLEY